MPLKAADILPALSRSGAGTSISCWAQPRASRSSISGLRGQAIKVALAAPPVDGKANACLVAFLSDALSLPKSSLEIVSGESSRNKRVVVRGPSPEQVAEMLAKASAAKGR